jgi:hypothetical protein
MRRVSGKEPLIADYAGGESGARGAARAGSAVVVVDAFRASTTIALLVSKGAGVVPVVSVEEAASADADFRIGERGSAKVAGFDFGNSPTEILGSEIPSGSTVVLSTTNGTRAIVTAAARCDEVVTGSLLNLAAVAAAARERGEDVAVEVPHRRMRRTEDEQAETGERDDRPGDLQRRHRFAEQRAQERIITDLDFMRCRAPAAAMIEGRGVGCRDVLNQRAAEMDVD